MRKNIYIAVLSVGIWFVCASSWHRYEAVNPMQNLSKKGTPAMGKQSNQPGSKEYVLEVIGLGVTLDKFRQGALWVALQDGNAYTTIRDLEPRHYPWTGDDKAIASRVHEGASLENGVLDTPTYWGVPVFNAEIACQNKDCMDRPELPQGGLVSGAMEMHLFVLADRELSERPDRILERIFNFFDQHPDVPYVFLGSADSSELRRHYSPSSKSSEDGYVVPERPDASALLVLARRERVDAIRPFSFVDIDEPKTDIETLNRHGVGRQVYLSYLELQGKVPLPPGSPLAFKGGGRQPTSAEWLAETAKLAVRPDIRSAARISLGTLTNKLGLQQRPQIPTGWKPTPWFPVPWSKEQIDQFDGLPTLGFIHRPVFVKMTDADSKPLQREADRQLALQAGWKEALQTLPERDRSAGPARVLVATGNNTRQLLNFHALLRNISENGGPEIDPSQPTKFIDVDRRLGNTGAATFFVQMAIGVMGSYREGGVSAAFNLRDIDEASIIFITPPPDEKRKTQQHPIGGDVFQNATVPAIDPKNYEEPKLK
ncbi:DUF2875 domain-containing protein [Rugamonas sp. FT107W]|uniref:DUF2875 domain-containing protein n=1 Tax=Duganella vulcania TaxID=2692166 RepID=A0A845HME7_9BURK|nr:DUF2875 family protein [Duganella vulcania]MYN19961.1 DUF2875 domain-containing protein [Duganella vulcania]